jgi:hypothetical protein
MMTDQVQARREARRQKILNSSNDRLGKITNLYGNAQESTGESTLQEPKEEPVTQVSKQPQPEIPVKMPLKKIEKTKNIIQSPSVVRTPRQEKLSTDDILDALQVTVPTDPQAKPNKTFNWLRMLMMLTLACYTLATAVTSLNLDSVWEDGEMEHGSLAEYGYKLIPDNIKPVVMNIKAFKYDIDLDAIYPSVAFSGGNIQLVLYSLSFTLDTIYTFHYNSSLILNTIPIPSNKQTGARTGNTSLHNLETILLFFVFIRCMDSYEEYIH